MPAVSEVQDALAAYVAAVNAKVSELEAALAAAAPEDLQPLADDLAAAQAELNPPVA